jgi:hypothetical protein
MYNLSVGIAEGNAVRPFHLRPEPNGLRQGPPSTNGCYREVITLSCVFDPGAMERTAGNRKLSGETVLPSLSDEPNMLGIYIE